MALLYFIGTAQSHVPQADASSELTTHFTRDEKKRVADILTLGDENIPIVYVCHRTDDMNKDVCIGRVLKGMVDSKGDLLVAGELNIDTPETRTVIDGINNRSERWGLSVCTAFVQEIAHVTNKKIVNVGITHDPAYGNWIHFATYTSHTLAVELDVYLHEPGMYVPDKMRGNNTGV